MFYIEMLVKITEYSMCNDAIIWHISTSIKDILHIFAFALNVPDLGKKMYAKVTECNTRSNAILVSNTNLYETHVDHFYTRFHRLEDVKIRNEATLRHNGQLPSRLLTALF